jgi:signal transduction histidine kinase
VSERVSGAVRAARSDEAVESSVNRAWALIGALVAALLAASAAAAVVLARRLAKPLEQLAAAAQSLGDGRGTADTSYAVAEVDSVATALAAAAERVAATLARERAFSADASHQLRTPLAALRLELEALELRGHRSDEVTAALNEVERLQSTVETLLALARDVPQAVGEVDVHELVDEVTTAWRPRLAAAARPLRIRLPPGPVGVRSAPTLVREVLDVLLANALEHGAGAVTVTLRLGGDWAHLDVSDEGPGVGDAGETLFERRVEAGRGIGLALARSLARAEGGELVASGGDLHADAAHRPILRRRLTVLSPFSQGPVGTFAPLAISPGGNMRRKLIAVAVGAVGVGAVAVTGYAGSAGASGSSAPPSRLDDGASLLPQAKITEQEAIKAAQGAASGPLNEVDLEHYQGKLVFNVDVGKSDVKVDASDGTVLGTPSDDRPSRDD